MSVTSNYVLYHSGEKRKGHKYVARIQLKSGATKKRKYRYFYSMDEYRAYLQGLKSGDKGRSTSDKVGGFLSKMFGKSKSTFAKAKSSFGSFLNFGKKFVTKPSFQKKKLKEFKRETISLGEKFISKKFGKKLKKATKKSNSMSALMNTKVGDIDKNKVAKGKKKVSKLKLWKKKIKDIGKDFGDSIKKAKDFIKDSFNNILGIKDKSNPEATLIGKAVKTVKSFAEMKKKSKKFSKKEDMAAINPNYDKSSWEYTNNCTYCTTAYDLRRRGYDVEAAPVEYGKMETVSNVFDWYDGEKAKTVKGIDHQPSGTSEKELAKAIEKSIKENGDGSRGHFIVAWTDGGAHDIAWEVEDGKVVLRDCQTNQTRTVKELIPYADQFVYFRTDNIDVNEKALKGIVNKKKKGG